MQTSDLPSVAVPPFNGPPTRLATSVIEIDRLELPSGPPIANEETPQIQLALVLRMEIRSESDNINADNIPEGIKIN